MQLFFRHFGKKGHQPLIIMHGLFGISDNWVTFGKQMAAAGFEVFIPDQRNHGRSEWSDDFNYLALTNDLYDFIDAEEIENPVLMGHSMGGKVAMRFAVSYPDLVKKLIVVDIAPKPYAIRQQHLLIIQAVQQIKLEEVKSRTAVEQQLAQTIEDERVRKFILKNLHRTEKNTFAWRINPKGIADNLSRMSDTMPDQKKYEKPALFIKGELSDYILPEDEPLIKEYFPQAEIVSIPGATHWVHADAPEQLFYSVVNFLADTAKQQD